MNEDLKKQLLEMLQHLLSSVEKGAAFIADQVPPLVQEKIALGRAEETFYIVFGLLILVIGTITSVRLWIKFYNLCDSHETTIYDLLCCLSAGGTVFSVIAGTTMTTSNLHNFLLVWFAPRLYIVEWLRELVK